MKKAINHLLKRTVLKNSIFLWLAIVLFMCSLGVVYSEEPLWNLSIFFALLGLFFLGLFCYFIFFGARANFKEIVNLVLESNRKSLQNEKEAAWKKMARQVAKDIEDPITPMKLSVQYLQNALKKSAPNTIEIANKMANSLLEQIELLTKIAREFSVFSQIGNPIPHFFYLDEAIELELKFQFPDGLHFVELIKEAGEYPVQADLSHFKHLFKILLENSNHLRVTDGAIMHTRIMLSHLPIQELVSIHYHHPINSSDWARSLNEPDFSYGSQGMELGLYTCKLIVEKAKGTIELETLPSGGTHLQIRFPKVMHA